MKIVPIPISRREGSILVLVIVISAILGMSLASYLSLVQSQHRAMVRSQFWNSTVSLVEAGIEEALAHLNKNCVSNSLSRKPVNFSADTWIPVSGGVRMIRQLGDGYYEVTIDTTKPLEPRILASGHMPDQLAAGAAAVFALVGVEATPAYISRTVHCTTTNQPLFVKGLVAKGAIDLSGNNVESDSYDSSDPSASTNGRYDESKRGDKGDIATNSSITDSLNVGNANIYGRAQTGADGSIAMGPNGTVGSEKWNDDGNKGIEPNWSSDDMNVSFPDVQSPFATALPPAGGIVDGETYDFVLGTGNHLISYPSELTGKVLVTGDAVVRVDSRVHFTGSNRLTIQTNASLHLYVNCPSATITGNGLMNETAQPGKFMYFGMPANTSLQISGNAEVNGVIYAPQAAVHFGGGGNNDFDLCGAAVVESAKLNGHFKIHYDENLGRNSLNRGFVITSWAEQ